MRSLRPHNPVLLLLVATAGLAIALGGFVTLAPNRLVSGRAIPLWLAAPPGLAAAMGCVALLLIGAAFVPPSRWRNGAAAWLAGLLLLLTWETAGKAAALLAAAAPAASRISLGAAFWVVTGATALALVDTLQRAAAGLTVRFVAAGVAALAFLGMARAGVFDALSLAHEYAARSRGFAAAMLRHIELVAAAVAIALAVGFPLGIAATRHARWQGPVFAGLNLLQTIPSIALFGLLLVPLAALAAALPALARLGVGGIGPAPAIIALVLYALLPVVRSTVAGLGGVDPAVIDAARGMGLSRRQLFWNVELPLAAPVLLSGLRIVTVQTIGLAVVAALIGAGGLGSLVFEGLGQYAADLVLLGALPAILLALAADFLMQSAVVLLGRHIAAGRPVEARA